MPSILLTGMSGVGRSTILKAIQADGYKIIDLDDGWIYYDKKLNDYLMPINELIMQIDKHKDDYLFIAGTTINQKELYPYLAAIITLTAPIDIILQRIQTRTNNPFGKTEDEWAKIISDKVQFEQQLIDGSNLVISTDQPLQSIKAELYYYLNINK